MSGGFGRGKIIDDSSYFPESRFNWVENGTRGNRNESGSMRGSHRNNFSNSDFSSPSDTGDCVGNNRGSRTFTRGGRESGFSSNRKDDDRYSFDRENDFSSGFSAGRRGGFSSGYGGRGGGFLVENSMNRRFSNSGGRGGGFHAGDSSNDGSNFGSDHHTGDFSGGRNSNFGGFDYDNDSGDFANHKRGSRRGHAFSSGRGGGFHPIRSDFDSDRDESFAFDNKYSGFSSGRSGRGGHSFNNSRNNDNFGEFGSRANNGETSFGTRRNFNSGFSSEGNACFEVSKVEIKFLLTKIICFDFTTHTVVLGRIGFGRSNFSSDWDDRRKNDQGNWHLSDLKRDVGAGFGDRISENGGRASLFSSHVPEDRSVEEMYKEDEENAKYEISDLDQEVTITGVPQLQKMLRLDDWKNAGFGDLLLRNVIEKSFYSTPRRIQAAVIPLIQNSWDIVGHAETGSGKTAAFVLPIINYIMNNGEKNDSRCAPIALILAPTRELVGQLYNQTRKFANGTGVTVAKAYGQYKLFENIMELERGCNILFATMGRLKDFVDHGKVKLHNINFFVLDEADRMLSQDSFQTDIINLIHRPDFPSVKDRQTLLFSATITREVQDLAAKVLKENHAFVSNGKIISANPLVEQNFIEVTSENKFDKLIQLLEEDRENNGDVARTLVFVQRKQMADVIALNLIQKNIQSSSISGDRVQKQREEALSDFRKGNIKVLVATDVCARGIDVKDLQHVINYDMPSDRITYIHRIGRTGRLHRGKATSFINLAEDDSALIADIVQVVQDVQQIPPDFLLDIANGRCERVGYVKSQRML
ncbi:hypothetical protein WUBG_05340 [Wuchereria bancrofti]|uniref:RNA helicase n=1 Tax=Wuchereria bancrofti TaxID=6293 RepID=J9F8R5_WUCBA|nr:hypothetical protein WUBG_05340 [Wuchereria bancrofti]